MNRISRCRKSLRWFSTQSGTPTNNNVMVLDTASRLSDLLERASLLGYVQLVHPDTISASAYNINELSFINKIRDSILGEVKCLEVAEYSEGTVQSTNFKTPPSFIFENKAAILRVVKHMVSEPVNLLRVKDFDVFDMFNFGQEGLIGSFFESVAIFKFMASNPTLDGIEFSENISLPTLCRKGYTIDFSFTEPVEGYVFSLGTVSAPAGILQYLPMVYLGSEATTDTYLGYLAGIRTMPTANSLYNALYTEFNSLATGLRGALRNILKINVNAPRSFNNLASNQIDKITNLLCDVTDKWGVIPMGVRTKKLFDNTGEHGVELNSFKLRLAKITTDEQVDGATESFNEDFPIGITYSVIEAKKPIEPTEPEPTPEPEEPEPVEPEPVPAEPAPDPKKPKGPKEPDPKNPDATEEDPEEDPDGDPTDPDKDPEQEPEEPTELNITTAGDSAVVPKIKVTVPNGEYLFKISEGGKTSLDEFLYICEIHNLIKIILDDPPAGMADSQRNILTTLVNEWLYLLDIESITSLVGSVLEINKK